MQEFKDSEGEVWLLALPIGEIKRIERESSGVYCLLEPHKGELAARLDADPMFFYDLLQILCQPQAEAKGIDAEGFGRRMAADCLLTAQRMFFEVWRDFFRQLGRVELARGVELVAKQRAKALELLAAKLQEGEPMIAELEAKSTREISAALGEGFGKLRALLESPTPKRSIDLLGASSTGSRKEKR